MNETVKIYCIENIKNNKKYIGVTSGSIENRFKEHLWLAGKENYTKQHLHNAINLHGKENFKITKIDEAVNYNIGFEMEKFWIKFFDSKNCGYNETDGGEGSPGKVVTEETKRKISKSYTGRNQPKEEKLRRSQSMKGKHDGKNNPFYGKTHSKETIEKYLSHKSQCIYCGIITTNANIKRWHNENCKMKDLS